MRYDDKYLDDAANLTHLRKVLVELDTICDTAIGQELDYDIIDSIEKDVKERLASVEKKLYDHVQMWLLRVQNKRKPNTKQLWHGTCSK